MDFWYIILWNSLYFTKIYFTLFVMGKKTFRFDIILARKFGKRIKDLRLEQEISQEELAFRANISPSYMSAIERGITDTTISTAKRLAKALQVSIADLFI